MIELITGFLLFLAGVVVTLLVLLGWFIYQAGMIERETSGEEYHGHTTERDQP